MTDARRAAASRCTCPAETPNEVACFQRHPDGSVTCGVCGGWNQTCPGCGELIDVPPAYAGHQVWHGRCVPKVDDP
jgi:hypothetical protein